MKRSSDASAAHSNRRALLRHHDPELLADPDVVAFLDGADAHRLKYRSIERQLVLANEPALLLDLIGVTGKDDVRLSGAYDMEDEMPPLPDGLLEFVADHINEVPCVTSLTITQAVLTAQVGAKLQTSLGAPGCALTTLAFVGCSFADAQVNFITDAPTIEAFTWSNVYDQAPQPPELDRVVPALANWRRLETVSFRSLSAPLNFAVIAQLLLANPVITTLDLSCDTAPATLGTPGQASPGNPVLLFEVLRTNRSSLTRLNFQVATPGNLPFAAYCIQCVGGCMLSNTTLQTLQLPGVALCSDAFRQRFETSLQRNRAITALGPRNLFSGPMQRSIVANANRHIWLTEDFIRGALGAFMQLMGTTKDPAALVASHLYSTPYEQTYCGAIVALLCKAAQPAGVQMRSAGLRVAIKNLMRSGNEEGCLALLKSLGPHGLGLLPADKADVVHFAATTDRLSYLPAGYAT